MGSILRYVFASGHQLVELLKLVETLLQTRIFAAETSFLHLHDVYK